MTFKDFLFESGHANELIWTDNLIILPPFAPPFFYVSDFWKSLNLVRVKLKTNLYIVRQAVTPFLMIHICSNRIKQFINIIMEFIFAPIAALFLDYFLSSPHLASYNNSSIP